MNAWTKNKVGDRVRIKRKDIFPLKQRIKNGDVFGKIVNIDGDNIMVKPMWCKWEIELYGNEIEKA